jgi:hypothetical protein
MGLNLVENKYIRYLLSAPIILTFVNAQQVVI